MHNLLSSTQRGCCRGVDNSRAFPAFALALSSFRENIVSNHLFTVLKSVGVQLTGTVVVAGSLFAFGACGGTRALCAVVHARDAIVGIVFVVCNHALFADTLCTTNGTVGSTVVVNFTACTVIFHELVVIRASLAGSNITSAVNAIVDAPSACTVVVKGVTTAALFTVAINITNGTVGDSTFRALILIVHVVTVNALFASDWTLGRNVTSRSSSVEDVEWIVGDLR